MLCFGRLCLVLISAVSLAFAQDLTKTDLVYVVKNWPSYAQVLTYQVDPHSAAAREVGTPIRISPNAANPVISADDQFIYFYGGDAGNEHIWVYATDAQGAPRRTPVQVLNVSNLYSLQIAPNSKFAYAVEFATNDQEQTLAKIRMFAVDPRTGLMSNSSELLATYGPNGPCGTGWSVLGLLTITGFNKDGSQLQENWFCSAHDWAYNAYYTRSIDQRTGAIGPEVLRFAASGGDAVYFRKNAVIDYTDPAGVLGNAVIYFYPPSGGTNAMFSCSSAIIAACGTGYGALPDQTGRFIFLQESLKTAEVAKVELAEDRLVDTGMSIPSVALQFSPDNLLLYTQKAGSWLPPFYLPIYAFDQKTGAEQQGDTLEVESPFYSITPVVRYR